MGKTKKKKQTPVQNETKSTSEEVKKEIQTEQNIQTGKSDPGKIEVSNQVFQQNQFPNLLDSNQFQDRRIQIIERVVIPKEEYEKIINENEKLKNENKELMNEMKKYCQLYDDLTRRTTNQDTRILDLEHENKLMREENNKLKEQLKELQTQNKELQNRLSKLEENEQKRTQLGLVCELASQIEKGIMSEVTKDSQKKIFKFTHIKNSNVQTKERFQETCVRYKFDEEKYEEVLNTLKESRLPVAHIFSESPTPNSLKEFAKNIFPADYNEICELIDILSNIRKNQNINEFYTYNFK
jgi:chromosome segregation ATPase